MTIEKKILEYLWDDANKPYEEDNAKIAIGLGTITAGFLGTTYLFAELTQRLPQNTPLKILTGASFLLALNLGTYTFYEGKKLVKNNRAYKKWRAQNKEAEQLIRDNFALIEAHEPVFRNNMAGEIKTRTEFEAKSRFQEAYDRKMALFEAEIKAYRNLGEPN